MSNIVAWGALAFFALFSSVESSAQEGYEALADTSLSIEEVTVAARSFREVVPNQKLQGEDLKRLGSHSVADALRFFAGVQVKDYGGVGGIKTINIRSMGTNHTGIAYDGVMLGNAQNGQVDLGMYSLDNMEAVTLHNGQRSEIFQSAQDFNNAGTVYLWTRRPRFTSDRRFNIIGTFKTGSFDIVNPSLTADLRIAQQLAATISGEYLHSSGEYTFRYRRQDPHTGAILYDTTAVRHNGDIEATRAEAAIFAQLSNAELYFKLYKYVSHRGVPGAIVNNVWRRGERISDDNTFAQATLTLTPGGRYRLKALGKWALYKTHYVNRDTTALPADNHYDQREAYASTANLFSVNNWWDVCLSIDAAWNDMTADLYNFAEPMRWTFMASLATSLALGNVKAQASVVATRVNDKANRIDLKANRCAWTPALFISYRPAGCPLAIRAFAKRSFRMPTFNDLYYTEVGNSRLNPERATQVNIGLSLNHTTDIARSISIQADVYYNEVKDKIVAYPKGRQFRWTMLNLGRVEIRGVDFSASAVIEPATELKLSPRVQYTFLQAIDVTNSADSYYRDQIPYIPRHSCSAALTSSWRGWGLDYSFVYTGERWNQQENIVYNYVMPWYTHDVSILRDFALPHSWGTIRLQLEINNLLDQDYDVISNYPMPGRNARVTLRYSL